MQLSDPSSEGTATADMEEEDDIQEDGDEEELHRPRRTLRAAGGSSAQLSSRSRASSPDGSGGGGIDYLRLTARQRARMDKEAGLAEDQQWHEIALPPELAYTWRGRDRKGPGDQLTEEEWLRRQEGLERRRRQSQRHRREAEESVKARLRKAVSAKFRGKLGTGGDVSGTEGEPGSAAVGQKVPPLQPGWVKQRENAEGVSLSWHPAAHPLSYPMATALPQHPPRDPVDLAMSPTPDGTPYADALRPGTALVLRPVSQQVHPSPQQQQPQQEQQQELLCVDSSGRVVGCLQQADALCALSDSGARMPDPQTCDWAGWQAVVRSIRRSADDQLATVIVRLCAPQKEALRQTAAVQ